MVDTLKAVSMTEPEAIRWLAELFEESPDAITRETPRTAIPMWDSLGVLTLIAELDERFNLTLSDADIEHLRSVGDVLELLRNNSKLV